MSLATRLDWDAAMQRWIHRTDIVADLNTVWAVAKGLTLGRWMGPIPPDYLTSDDALVANLPRPMLHAGLMHLHELAQDDIGASREAGLFSAAIDDAQFRYSMDNVTPDMFAVEETTSAS